jgi:hypothetical protein
MRYAGTIVTDSVYSPLPTTRGPLAGQWRAAGWSVLGPPSVRRVSHPSTINEETVRRGEPAIGRA